MTTSSPRQAMLLFALFSLLWVLMEEELGALFQHRYELAQVVWCRYAVHLSLLGVLFGWRGPQQLWRTGRRSLQLQRSICMVVMPFSFILALQAGAAADEVWSLFWVAPLAVLAIARRWPPDAAPFASRRVWWICAGCTLAAALMMWPHLWPFVWPTGLWPVAAAAMAFSFAVYVVMTRSLRDEPVQTNLFYSALGPILALAPFMPGVWLMPTLHDAAVMFSIGALGLVALWALDRAVASAPLSLSAPALYTYLPILGAIDWWAQGNTHTRREVVMVGAICLALAYVWRQLPRVPSRAGQA